MSLGVDQDPVTSGGNAQPAILVRHLKHTLHMGALCPVLPGLHCEHIAVMGPAVDVERHTGEQKGIAHLHQHLTGHAPCIVVIPTKAGDLAQQGGHADPLVAVALAKGHFLLPDIAVFR